MIRLMIYDTMVLVQEWIKDAKDGYQIDKFTDAEKKDFERLRVF